MAIVCYGTLGNRVTRFYQWDINQKLVISGVETSPVPVFQFSNDVCGGSISVSPTVSGSSLIVDVPNALLEEAKPLLVFIFRNVGGAGNTIGSIRIPVRPRVAPDDTIYD